MSAGSRITVDISGDSAPLQAAVSKAADALKGLGSELSKQTDLAVRGGERTVATNDAVATSYQEMARATTVALQEQMAAVARASAALEEADGKQVISARKVLEAQTRAAAVAARASEEITAAAREQAKAQSEAAVQSEKASADSAGAASRAATSHQTSAKKVENAFGSSSSALTKSGKAITLGLLATAAASADLAVKFQQSTTRLQTQAGATARQVDQLRQGMLRMASEVGYTPDQLSQGMYHVVSSMNAVLPAAQRVGTELAVLRASAEGARIGGANLEDTTYALASAMNALHAPADQAQHIMGLINATVGAGDMTMQDYIDSLKSGLIPAARESGVSLQSVGAALAVMGDMGMRGALAGTRLRMAIALLSSPSEAAAKVLQTLGMSATQATSTSAAMATALSDAGLRTTQLSQDLHHPNGILVALQDLNTHLRASGLTASGAAAVMSKAFGGARTGATITLLAQNTGRLDTKFKQIGDSANQFGHDWATQQQTVSQELHDVEGGVAALGVRIGTDLLPYVKDAVADGTDFVKWLEHGSTAAHALEVTVGTLATVSIGSYLVSQIKKATGLVKDLRTAFTAPMRLGGTSTTGGATTGMLGAGDTGALGIGGAKSGYGLPGSIANPIIVAMEAGEYAGLGSMGAAGTVSTDAKAAASEAGAAEAAAGPGAVVTRQTTAAAEEASVAAGAMSSVKSMLGSVMKGGMIAGTGVAASQIAGSAIGGTAGHAVSTIGSGASIGAGLGSLAGPEGTVVGAIGGAIVGGIYQLLKSPNFGQQIASGVFQHGFGGSKAPSLSSQLAAALNQLHKDTTQVTRHAAGRGGFTNSTAQLDIMKLDPTQQAAALAAANKAGQLVAKSLEAGWDQYKFQSEPIMFTQLKAKLATLPPAAQDAAIQSALSFANTLVKEGKLPADATAMMLAQVEKQFPEFTQFMGMTAYGGVTQFTNALDFKQAEQNVQTAMNNMRGDFPQVVAAMDSTAGDVQTKAAAVVTALQGIVNTGTRPMRTQAEADLQALQDATDQSMTAAAGLVLNKTAGMATAVKNNLGNASQTAYTDLGEFAQNVEAAMSSGALSTGKGLGLIISTLNKALKEMGQKQLSPLQVATVNLGVGKQFQLQHQGAATGGYIGMPGARGRDNVPVVLGDGEAVLNHGQQQVVNGALAAVGIGGLPEVFSKVTTPHYMATGGYAGSPGPNLNYSQLEGLWDQANPQLRADAPLMAAIAMAESSGRDVVNSIGAAGYWQIYGLPFAGNPLDPVTNAKMAGAKLDSQGPNAWVTYQTGAYRQFLHGNVPASMGGISAAPLITAPKVTGSGAIADVVTGALGQAATAANSYLGTLSPAASATSGGGPAFVTPTGKTPTAVTRALSVARSQLGKPYITGGYGPDAPGLDCSGYVSTVLNQAGLDPAGHLLTGGLKSWGLPGPGQWITVGVWGADSGPLGHTMMMVDGQYFESGGNQNNVHQDAGWSMPFTWWRHPPGLAGGGYVGNPDHQMSAKEFADLKKASFPGAVKPRKPAKPPKPGKAPAGISTGMTTKDMQNLSKVGGQVNSIESQIARLSGQYQVDTTLFPPQEQSAQYLNPDGSMNAAGYAKMVGDYQAELSIDRQLLTLYQQETPVVSAALKRWLGNQSVDDHKIASNKAKIAANKIREVSIRKAILDLTKPGPNTVQTIENQIKQTELTWGRTILSAEKAKLSFDESSVPRELSLEQAVINAEKKKLGYSAIATAGSLKQAVLNAQAHEQGYTGTDHATKTQLSDAVDHARNAYSQFLLNQAPVKAALTAAGSNASLALRQYVLSEKPTQDQLVNSVSNSRLSEQSALQPLKSALFAAQVARQKRAQRIKAQKFHLSQELQTLTGQDTKLAVADTNLSGILSGANGSTSTNQTVNLLETVAGKLGMVQWSSGGNFAGIDTSMPGEIVSVQADIQSLTNDIGTATSDQTGTTAAATTTTTMQTLEAEIATQVSEMQSLQAGQTNVLSGFLSMLGATQIPSYDVGGPILRDTLAQVHANEYVVPERGALVMRGGNSTPPNVELHQHYHGNAGALMSLIDQRIQHPDNVMAVSKQIGRRTRMLRGAPGW